MKLGELSLREDVSKDDVLETSDGKKITSVRELVFYLDNMDDETFSSHVSKTHNDFRDWILEAYGDADLAKRIGSTRRRKKIASLLEKALKKSKRFSAHEINAPKRKRDILSQIKEAAKIK